MVNKIKRGDKTLFACSECGMAYKKMKSAEHCEVRCRKGLSCQGKMIRHSVQFSEE